MPNRSALAAKRNLARMPNRSALAAKRNLASPIFCALFFSKTLDSLTL